MLNKSMGKSTLMTALITGSVIWGGYTVGHAEEQQAFFLDEMVVTATRTPVEAFKANANISVITKKKLKKDIIRICLKHYVWCREYTLAIIV
ncbi:hypothetical protein H9Y09_08375 [Phascolarctobacterium faecium]|uniref:hypothetical protein n=1 Tax=Phascolarctobacterium faecium TaxID=33025 RepID=UPI001659F021|nr:hypothetical protein [Phascolarctobacterium faecium]QNP76702.1 hypothetical protein H9Y09_08375 [Phascolarctobacterium faecium]